MSALAWLQTALLSGYGRRERMHAMHGELHRAFVGEPHCLRATVRGVYSISYWLPDRQCTVVGHVWYALGTDLGGTNHECPSVAANGTTIWLRVGGKYARDAQGVA